MYTSANLGHVTKTVSIWFHKSFNVGNGYQTSLAVSHQSFASSSLPSSSSLALTVTTTRPTSAFSSTPTSYSRWAKTGLLSLTSLMKILTYAVSTGMTEWWKIRKKKAACHSSTYTPTSQLALYTHYSKSICSLIIFSTIIYVLHAYILLSFIVLTVVTMLYEHYSLTFESATCWWQIQKLCWESEKK